jgi:hypothetical protein
MAKKQSYLKRKQTFSGAQVLLFVLVFAAIGAVAIWQSLAAPHNGGGKPSGGSSSLTGPVMVNDLNGDGQANHKDTIDFNVSTSATQPQVGVRCYQGGNWVYDAYKSYYNVDPSFAQPFTLDSGYWQSGTAATCQARLFYSDKRGKQVVLTTLSFQVNP